MDICEMTGFLEEPSSIKLIRAKDLERQIAQFQTEIKTHYHHNKSIKTRIQRIHLHK